MGDDDVEYELEAFSVGGHSFEVTTIAFLPIETLMANQSRDVEISGQKLWCGSLAVAEYLLGTTTTAGACSWVSEATVVELGAGTGVLGMLCKRLGARNVVLTDNDVRSLQHMKADCERNNVEAQVEALDWFTVSDSVPPLPQLSNPSRLRIVAGDVLYKKVLLAPFMRTVRGLLRSTSAAPSAAPSAAAAAGGDAQMVLCHVPRAGVEQADVVSCAGEHGLQVEVQPRELWCRGAVTEYCPTEDTDRAVVYLISLLPTE